MDQIHGLLAVPVDLNRLALVDQQDPLLENLRIEGSHALALTVRIVVAKATPRYLVPESPASVEGLLGDLGGAIERLVVERMLLVDGHIPRISKHGCRRGEGHSPHAVLDGRLDHVERALDIDIDRIKRELARVHDHHRCLMRNVFRLPLGEDSLERSVVRNVADFQSGCTAMQVLANVIQLRIVEVVYDDDEVALFDKLIGDERADVSCSASHENYGHRLKYTSAGTILI